MKFTFFNIFKSRSSFIKWFIFLVLATIIGFGSVGYLDAIRDQLDKPAFSFSFGEYRISLYVLIKATLIVVFIFWAATVVSDLICARISGFKNLRAANRELLNKVIQIVIYLVSFILTLDILGIDLTTLTVFSGALGIGLGFGLQKIASNFISGLILLMEKSIEQDDLVEIGDGAIGFIRKASARFTLLETFDGKEIMIPNEDFITNRVTNWTYSNTNGRVEIIVGVSYSSDLEKVREILLQAAGEHPKCTTEPVPTCYLREFGDSSVNFTLHFWVQDVTTGRWGPKSEVMFSIWHKFKQNGIEIPFPQRDLHLKSPQTINVTSDAK
jgi:small-conductance mechanosensitive channel